MSGGMCRSCSELTTTHPTNDAGDPICDPRIGVPMIHIATENLQKSGVSTEDLREGLVGALALATSPHDYAGTSCWCEPTRIERADGSGETVHTDGTVIVQERARGGIVRTPQELGNDAIPAMGSCDYVVPPSIVRQVVNAPTYWRVRSGDVARQISVTANGLASTVVDVDRRGRILGIEGVDGLPDLRAILADDRLRFAQGDAW